MQMIHLTVSQAPAPRSVTLISAEPLEAHISS